MEYPGRDLFGGGQYSVSLGVRPMPLLVLWRRQGAPERQGLNLIQGQGQGHVRWLGVNLEWVWLEKQLGPEWE